MKRFKRILFVVKDGSKSRTPLKRAVALAKSNQADLTFIDVLDTPPEETKGLIKGVADKLEDMLVAQRQAMLDKLVALAVLLAAPWSLTPST